MATITTLPTPSHAGEVLLAAEDVKKYYGDDRSPVLEMVTVELRDGEFVALLGPSGSGKSTLLRILAGLMPPSEGRVLVHGEPLHGPNAQVAIVFQSFALFPWLTVLDNVELGLLATDLSPAERRGRAEQAIDMIGLAGYEEAFPKELSGGMKQRVGFARALVVHPEVLFMDEPFSALDVLTADNLRSELLELWQKKTIPTKAIFLVTHNIEEAVLLADRIIVLGRNPGHVRTDFKVALAQPRERKSHAFTALVDYIYIVLTQPDVAPTEVPVLVDGRRVRDQRQMRYEMLPHARPGGIA